MENRQRDMSFTDSFTEITRRRFLGYAAGAMIIGSHSGAPPMAAQFFSSTAPPIPEPHFPDRLHLFVWRNWELANTDRMAKLLGTTEERILEIGASLGLPSKPRLSEDQLRRVYITVIRQNWHVIPDNQIIDLLGWTREHFEFTLKEDDFLDHKLGRVKPDLQPLRYEPPSAAAQQRAAEIKRTLQEVFGNGLAEAGEPSFAFVERLSRVEYPDYRAPNRAVSDKEVDVTGWSVVEPANATQDSGAAARQFVEYLNHTFRSRSQLGAASSSPGPKSIALHIDPRISTVPMTFEIDVKADGVRVVATDPAGLLQAIYRLQDQMESAGAPFLPLGLQNGVRRLSPAYLYSYFALYGDPLLEKDIDPFPEGYLQKLSRLGVNGVWLQGILRQLAPSTVFPEFGDQWQTRLSRLNELVARAARYGIKVYLYMNEPRAMGPEFFTRHPDIKGAFTQGDPQTFAMCTSVPKVRQWAADSLSHVFRQVPGLGGIFTISMSENLTNCFSKGTSQNCPRCSKREGWQVVAELHEAFVKGVHGVSPDAQVIAWDWGWGFEWVNRGADAALTIKHLPKEIKLQSISEWFVPVERGGFKARVGEYSISAPGPGPRANSHWAFGRQAGLEAYAKVQMNSTWEISAVPYIPVANLIQRHLDDLSKAGITGIMLSWTVGGYPSPNLEIAREYYTWPTPNGAEVLQKVATRRYGNEAAPTVLRAWETFSKAFEEFPYGLRIYIIPTQHGPANPIRLQETGYPAGMILFPYDDWEEWVKPYPHEIAQSQFQKMADLWKPGLQEMEKALSLMSGPQRQEGQKELGIAETCYLHFQSVANQLKFYALRKEMKAAASKRTHANEMIRLAEQEIELAKRLYTIARKDSTIGFEATNHYYYLPLDLAEKVLNCRQVIQELKSMS
jgi:hypothetical protein